MQRRRAIQVLVGVAALTATLPLTSRAASAPLAR
jgi:hypothetical protein